VLPVLYHPLAPQDPELDSCRYYLYLHSCPLSDRLTTGSAEWVSSAGRTRLPFVKPHCAASMLVVGRCHRVRSLCCRMDPSLHETAAKLDQF
jgi:hypothetical protein